MKLPRDVSGQRLVKALRKLGYEFTRQRDSHMRYTTEQHGQQHIAIPDHDSLRIGTLGEILKGCGSALFDDRAGVGGEA